MFRTSALSLTLLLFVACAPAGRPAPPMLMNDGGTSSSPTDVDAGTSPSSPPTEPPAAGAAEPGAACNCDTDCSGTTDNPGICVGGVCMQRASGTCAAAGSTAECPAGARCWGLEGFTGSICWPDCASHSCAGACDADGSCIASESTGCDPACGAVCDSGDGGDGGDGGGDGSGGCPPNSRPDGDSCVCNEGFVVNAERTGCVAQCMMTSECSEGLACVDGRCVIPPCTPGSCPVGSLCSEGVCVVDLGTPPPGPPPSCAAGVGMVPDWRCTSGCGDLLPFDPDEGYGYWDYPLNGETATDQYRSYVRRDVMMLVKYATAMVACQGAGWAAGNGGALGLGDMSEADGSIPGTRDGRPGHPAGTHVDGHDMDIAYYQTGTVDNRLRSVCEHTIDGRDQYHCTSDPHLLDPWRSALFIGHLHASPNLRVVGVDGKVGPLLDSATNQLCADGWLSGTACTGNRTTYETTDTSRGWFRFHHHHLHLSVSG